MKMLTAFSFPEKDVKAIYRTDLDEIRRETLSDTSVTPEQASLLTPEYVF